jgi:hypothetical protein
MHSRRCSLYGDVLTSNVAGNSRIYGGTHMDNVDIKTCAGILALCDSRLELLLKYMDDMKTITRNMIDDLSTVHLSLNDMTEK